MFKHPASTHTARRAYGELGGWDFYAFLLPNGFTLGSAGKEIAEYLKREGVALETDNKLPNGTVMLIETGAPGLSNYDVLMVNGEPAKFTISGRSVLFGGMGNGPLANTLENLLEDLAPQKAYSSFGQDQRRDAEKWMWAKWKTSPANKRPSGTSDAPTSEPDASDTSTSDTTLETSDAGEPAAAGKPKTGYYTDSGGYAWYYNAEKDYMEAVAAPKGKFSTQPRFDASKDARKYANMKGVLTSFALASRASAVSIATSNGGVELPAVAVGRPAPASTPPADVAARGEQKLDAKKVGGGFKGAVSAVPTWAWITLGTLTAAGGGYFVYRRFYKK
jgi:hypothetical protein